MNDAKRSIPSDIILDHVSASWGTDETLSITGAWPELDPGNAPADGDRDGIPDAWEKTHGLNPADAGDSRMDPDNDGYTNIEEYLNRTDPRQYVDYRATVTKRRVWRQRGAKRLQPATPSITLGGDWRGDQQVSHQETR